MKTDMLLAEHIIHSIYIKERTPSVIKSYTHVTPWNHKDLQDQLIKLQFLDLKFA